ncbi:MAG: T9SS type A sorting domain-containing protein [Prevotellaceae bacterium]|nr:T9SS type A sorting domain-containing protein [Prevotellaceae bacterium]
MKTSYRYICGLCMTIVAVQGFVCRASAQEMLVPLSENRNVQPQPAHVHKSSGIQKLDAGDNPLPLPFVGDFAPAHPYPDPAQWTTNGVYVNNHYALNMPTVGVATFDALNGEGRLYAHLSGAAAAADTLASLPIDLESKNNIALSFFYQPGGLGDMPGLLDKFMLEFYSPADDLWTEVWSVVYNAADSTITESREADTLVHKFDVQNMPFVYAALEVNAPWRQRGFQFRFVNYVTLTVNADVPGRASNADFWHLGMIYLNNNRDAADTCFDEVAMTRLDLKRNNAYASIPAYHLAASPAMSLDSFTVTYYNMGCDSKQAPVYYSINPLYGAGAAAAVTDEPVLLDNILAKQRRSWIQPVHYTFSATAADAAFEIATYLDIDKKETSPLRTALRHNDTLKHIQEFHDYYAYDDGSAENGYGLFGYGSSTGRVAVPFAPLMGDSLRGVYLYFNLAKDSANVTPFELAVWSDDGGVPGTILLRQKITRPAFDSLSYVAYKFKTPLWIGRNQSFYVGWIQSSETFLNIGYDANTPTHGKNLYSLTATGVWYESIYDGALMIRPIFCKAENFPGNHIEPEAEKTSAAAAPDRYMIYPNPASDWIAVRNLTDEEAGRVTPPQLLELYDLSGRRCFAGYTAGGAVSLSGLAAGVYLVRITDGGKIKTLQQIIVNE